MCVQCACVCAVCVCVCSCVHTHTHKGSGAWRCLVSNINECVATQDKERKDVMKKSREEAVQSESLALKCKMTGCGFVVLSVGLG